MLAILPDVLYDLPLSLRILYLPWLSRTNNLLGCIKNQDCYSFIQFHLELSLSLVQFHCMGLKFVWLLHIWEAMAKQALVSYRWNWTTINPWLMFCTNLNASRLDMLFRLSHVQIRAIHTDNDRTKNKNPIAIMLWSIEKNERRSCLLSIDNFMEKLVSKRRDNK